MMKIITTMIHPSTGEIMQDKDDIRCIELDNKHVAYLDDNTGEYCVACFNKQFVNVHYYDYHDYRLVKQNPDARYIMCACKTIIERKEIPL